MTTTGNATSAMASRQNATIQTVTRISTVALAMCVDYEPYGGERGCGLFFCEEHSHSTENHVHLCLRCLRGNSPYQPKPDVPSWIRWKLEHDSWKKWRDENQEKVEDMKRTLNDDGREG